MTHLQGGGRSEKGKNPTQLVAVSSALTFFPTYFGHVRPEVPRTLLTHFPEADGPPEL